MNLLTNINYQNVITGDEYKYLSHWLKQEIRKQLLA